MRFGSVEWRRAQKMSRMYLYGVAHHRGSIAAGQLIYRLPRRRKQAFAKIFFAFLASYLPGSESTPPVAVSAPRSAASGPATEATGSAAATVPRRVGERVSPPPDACRTGAGAGRGPRGAGHWSAPPRRPLDKRGRPGRGCPSAPTTGPG